MVCVCVHVCRPAERGGQKGQFAPGPQCKGAPKIFHHKSYMCIATLQPSNCNKPLKTYILTCVVQSRLLE